MPARTFDYRGLLERSLDLRDRVEALQGELADIIAQSRPAPFTARSAAAVIVGLDAALKGIEEMKQGLYQDDRWLTANKTTALRQPTTR